MTFKMEILSLETTGDAVRVRMQGKLRRAATWQRMSPMSFEVPEYKGKYLRIGQTLTIRVETER